MRKGVPKMETIGQRLKAWRKEKGLTMTEISEKTGLSTGGLSAYERDEKLIGSKPLIALWSEFDLDIAWLLTGKREGELSPEEQKLVNLYRVADTRGKRNIMRSAEAESAELESSDSKIG
ncbi:MAG: helix-turn-helix transcriptional regulator [Lachnospiraceae bacterium]|nr:helix-turn-helix transcriptional regulator [Lachnospiraceae bacterium]